MSLVLSLSGDPIDGAETQLIIDALMETLSIFAKAKADPNNGISACVTCMCAIIEESCSDDQMVKYQVIRDVMDMLSEQVDDWERNDASMPALLPPVHITLPN